MIWILIFKFFIQNSVFTPGIRIRIFKMWTRNTATIVDGSVEMSETMSEIVVPTISYRMGVKEMGAGLAVFSR